MLLMKSKAAVTLLYPYDLSADQVPQYISLHYHSLLSKEQSVTRHVADDNRGSLNQRLKTCLFLLGKWRTECTGLTGKSNGKSTCPGVLFAPCSCCIKWMSRFTVRLLKPGPPRQWKPIRRQNWNNRFQQFQIQPIKCPVQNNEISTCSLTGDVYATVSSSNQ